MSLSSLYNNQILQHYCLWGKILNKEKGGSKGQKCSSHDRRQTYAIGMPE